MKRAFPLAVCLAVVSALSPGPAGPAATSRSAGGPGVSIPAAGGRVPLPPSYRAATRGLPGGAVAVLLFSDPSVRSAWERSRSQSGGEVLIEVFPWSQGRGVEERAALFENDLRAVGWKNVARRRVDGRPALTASAPQRVRAHILTPTRHIRVTAARWTAEFERTLTDYRDDG